MSPEQVLSDDDPRIAYPSIDAAMQDDDQHDPLLAGFQTVSGPPAWNDTAPLGLK